MKTKINSPNDTLTFLLQGLYFTETKLKEEIPACCSQITSTRIRNEIDHYTGNADYRLQKLQSVFNYLMKEPLSGPNAVVNSLIRETHQLLASTISSHLKDVLSIGCIQNINAYKISGYRSAYMAAVELDLDTVTDILQQILERETETSRIFAEASIEEFNKAEQPMVT